MPIYDMEKSRDAMRALKDASDAESQATAILLELMQARADMTTLMEATQAMESAHARKMDAYAKLQEFRLD